MTQQDSTTELGEVQVPEDSPQVTPAVARTLLAILVELSEVPASEEMRHDR